MGLGDASVRILTEGRRRRGEKEREEYGAARGRAILKAISGRRDEEDDAAWLSAGAGVARSQPGQHGAFMASATSYNYQPGVAIGG